MTDIIARGIDVSYAQGKIDWAKVKRSGAVDFALIRAGYGWDNDRQIDKRFRANVDGCIARGIPFGLLGVIFTATGVSPEMFTDWGILWDNIVALVRNPFMLCSVIAAVVGYNTDPTTSGLGDSARAMKYVVPFKDGE